MDNTNNDHAAADRLREPDLDEPTQDMISFMLKEFGDVVIRGKRLSDMSLKEFAEAIPELKELAAKRAADEISRLYVAQRMIVHPRVEDSMISRFMAVHQHRRDIAILPGRFNGCPVGIITVVVTEDQLDPENREHFERMKADDPQASTGAVSPIGCLFMNEDMQRHLIFDQVDGDYSVSVKDPYADKKNTKSREDGYGMYL